MKATTRTTTRAHSSRVVATPDRSPARAERVAPPKNETRARAKGSVRSKTETRAARPKQHVSPVVDMAGAGAPTAESTPVVSAVPGAVLDRLAALVVERTQLLQAELRINNQIKANERLLTGGPRGFVTQEVRAADSLGDLDNADAQLPRVSELGSNGHQHLDTHDESAASDLARTATQFSGVADPVPAAARAPFATLALRQVRATLHTERLRFERRLIAEAKQLPVWPWVETVRGVGPLLLALIAGDSGDLATYANPAKLWKRWGLAVIDGRAQRRVADAEQAAIHGFNPRRRATMHVLGECLMKAGSPRYRPIYDERKAYELARLPADAKARQLWAHKRALRYMEKRFLLDLWRAWITSAAPAEASA